MGDNCHTTRDRLPCENCLKNIFIQHAVQSVFYAVNELKARCEEMGYSFSSAMVEVDQHLEGLITPDDQASTEG